MADVARSAAARRASFFMIVPERDWGAFGGAVYTLPKDPD
jgi:hypothetical protein